MDLRAIDTVLTPSLLLSAFFIGSRSDFGREQVGGGRYCDFAILLLHALSRYEIRVLEWTRLARAPRLAAWLGVADAAVGRASQAGS